MMNKEWTVPVSCMSAMFAVAAGANLGGKHCPKYCVHTGHNYSWCLTDGVDHEMIQTDVKEREERNGHK
jgi:hypothetical protein